MLLDAVFYLFAAIVVLSGMVVAMSRNIMYSAFSLLFTFFGVAGLYVLLNADFIAITQIMIYIGGILVLIIFGVMLTSNITGVDIKTGTTGKLQVMFSGVLALAVTLILVAAFNSSEFVIKDAAIPADTTKGIGVLLLTDYLIAFEAASALLLIAIVGAALIARNRKHQTNG